jgi:hypothetical protein
MSGAIVLLMNNDRTIEVTEAPEEIELSVELVGRMFVGLIKHASIENRVITIEATNGIFRYELDDVDAAQLIVRAHKI